MKKFLSCVRALLILGLIAGCGGTDVNQISGSPSGGVAMEVPERVDPTTGKPLPPHPGQAGLDAFEGIDSDGDGLRDDVQIWLITNFEEPLTLEELRKAKAAAILLQGSLLVGDDLDGSLTTAFDLMTLFDSLEHSHVISLARQLELEGLTPDEAFQRSRQAMNTLGELMGGMEERVVNTIPRYNAYQAYNEKLNGQVFTTSTEESDFQRANAAANRITERTLGQ